MSVGLCVCVLYLQMANLVRGHDNARKAATVLYDGHRVDLFKSLINHTSSADVGKARRSPVAPAPLVAAPAHVELCDDNRQIVGGQSILAIEILSHICKRAGRVNRVRIRRSQPVALQVGRRVAILGDNHTCQADSDVRMDQQLVAQINSIPKANKVTLNIATIATVKEKRVIVDD